MTLRHLLIVLLLSKSSRSRNRVFADQTMMTSSSCGSSPCMAGCYDSNADRLCEATPVGYYSPHYDDALYPCPAGTFAAQNASHTCTPCPLGTYVEVTASSTCYACPPGTYASTTGTTMCAACLPYFFYGIGAQDVLIAGLDAFCLEPPNQPNIITAAPTLAPIVSTLQPVSLAPTTRPPTYAPTTSMPMTSQPSLLLSDAPSASPSTMPSISRFVVVTDDALPTEWPTTSPTISTNQNNKSNDANEHRNSPRNEAFWQYFPLLCVALVLVLLAFILQRTIRRPQSKTKRPPRPIPPPPSPLNQTATASTNAVVTTKGTNSTATTSMSNSSTHAAAAAATAAANESGAAEGAGEPGEEDSLYDIYLEDGSVGAACMEDGSVSVMTEERSIETIDSTA